MANKKTVGKITIEGARIGFKNFSGKAGNFNKEGDRNFCVFLEGDFAEKLAADGWNVKTLKPRDEDEEPQPYLQVKVKYGVKPPTIYLVKDGKSKTKLDENELNILDWAEISNVDLIIRPFNWEFNGKTGITAYVDALFVTIVEDKLMQKYSNVPDSAQSAMVGLDDEEDEYEE